MKWTEKSDDRYDKKNGIKENSKKDVAVDRSRGLKAETTTKQTRAGSHSSKVVTSGKSPNSALTKASTTKPTHAAKVTKSVKTSGTSPNSQQSAGSTVKTSAKVANRRSLFERVKNIKVFND